MIYEAKTNFYRLVEEIHSDESIVYRIDFKPKSFFSKWIPYLNFSKKDVAEFGIKKLVHLNNIKPDEVKKIKEKVL